MSCSTLYEHPYVSLGMYDLHVGTTYNVFARRDEHPDYLDFSYM